MSREVKSRRGAFPNVQEVAQALSECYRDFSHGNKSNPLNELLFILCSLQANESSYKATYLRLCARFPSFRELAEANEEDISQVLTLGGLARQKARAIRRILLKLKSDFGRPSLAPLRTMSDADCESYLESLPGVGKKTARCVMMYSLQRNVFPVDSNCWRICRRLGWVRATRPDNSCSPRDMVRVENGIPPKLRLGLHVNFVSLGRARCLPAGPQCASCCIRDYCRTGKQRRAMGD